MKRRKLLSYLGAGPLVGASLRPDSIWALDTSSAASQFRLQLADKPWLLGYQSVDQEVFQANAKISGRMPNELRGTLYRNGPGQHQVGALRYEHWFDGDGLIQAFEISASAVTHRARLIQTHKRLKEKDAGRALYSTFGTVVPNAVGMSSADQGNPANISVLYHHDRLYALWEAGSAHAIDPQTLGTNGIHSFSTQTQGAPFSAHPRIDTADHLWNFGYSSVSRQLVLWHISPQGSLVKAAVIDCDPISMPHDFIVTSRHLVIMVPPLHFEDTDDNVSFLERHQWHPDRATRVLVVDKNDFDSHFWLELPAFWVFHFGNGWEDEAGIIRFDGSRYSNPNVMQQAFAQVMRGHSPVLDHSHHIGFRIDTRRRTIATVNIVDPDMSTEFPTIDPRVSCKRNNKILCLSANHDRSSNHGLLDSLSLLDVNKETMQTFTYPNSQIPEEHLFIPASESKPESEGWIVGLALDYQQARTHLNVFNAQALDAGPIATATLPYSMPLGLHGKFVNRA